MVMLRWNGHGDNLLSLHEEGRRHHPERGHNVPCEQQHIHHRGPDGDDGRVFSGGRSALSRERRQQCDYIPGAARGFRPGSRRTGNPTCDGRHVLPRTVICGPDLNDLHCRAVRQELRRSRSGQGKGSRIHERGDIPVRDSQCCDLDTRRRFHWCGIPPVSGGAGPHLGLRPHV